MRCLICGKEVEDRAVCDVCVPQVTEELCYKVAQYDYKEPNDELWAKVISELDAPYKFRDISLNLAEYISGERKNFVITQCMNLINGDYLGVPKRYRDFVILHESECEQNNSLTIAEKNLVKALLLGCHVSNYSWNLIEDIPDKIQTDDVFLETALILADYYMKICAYEKATAILEEAKGIFLSENDQSRIDFAIADITDRKCGKKKAWRPTKREDIDCFNQYLDKLGVDHINTANNKKEKVKESDFKPFVRYEKEEVPNVYVAVWITSEFYLKVNEAVEINAVRVSEGEIIDRFHTFVRPINKPKNPKYVKEEDYINAPLIKEAFSGFMQFVRNDILAIAGFDEQKRYLSRLARYSMLDHIDNEVFDVVEYGEDVADDFESYTRSTLLEKYGVNEGTTGMEKAEVTMRLVEKMRQ